MEDLQVIKAKQSGRKAELCSKVLSVLAFVVLVENSFWLDTVFFLKQVTFS